MNCIEKWLQSDTGLKIVKLINQTKIAQEIKKSTDQIKKAAHEVSEFTWRDAVSWVSQYLGDELTSDDIKTVMDNVINQLKLNNDLDKIKSFWKTIDQRTRDCLTIQLKDLKNTLSWKIIDWQYTAPPINGLWKSIIDADAGANLNFVMDAKPANPPIGKTQLPLDQCYFRMGLNGDIKGSASAAASRFSVLKASTNADLQFNLNLDYYFANPPERFVIEAATTNIYNIVSPLDANDIYNASLKHLNAIHLTAFGSLGCSMKISGGSVWETAFDIAEKSIKLNKTIKLPGSINVGYEASLKFQGNWDVLVSPIPPTSSNNSQKLHIILQRGREKISTSTFSLDATLGVEGLDEVGEYILQKFIPDASPLITALKEYLTFGQTIKTQVQDYLTNLLNIQDTDTIKKEMINLIMGNTSAQNISEAIGEKIEAAINEKLDLLENDAENAAINLIKSIGTKLCLKPFWIDFLVDKGKNEVTQILDHIKKGLQEKITTMVNTAETDITQLFKPLESIGTKVNEITAHIDSCAEKLLQPVIKFLEKYQEIRNLIINAIKKAVQLKIGLNYSHKVQTTRTGEALLELELDTHYPNTEDYFLKLMTGDYRQVINLWRAHPDGSAGITLIAGKLKDTLAKSITTDFSFNIFGLQFSSQSIFNSKITTETDPVGNICIASANAELIKYKSWLKESQTVRFVNLIEVAGTMNSTSTKNLSCGLALTYKDDCLKQDELITYLAPLESLGLLPTGTTEKAKTFYQTLPLKGSKEKFTAATINLQMPLTSDDIKTLIQSSPPALRTQAATNLITTHFPDKKNFQRFSDSLEKFCKRNPGFPNSDAERAIILGHYYGTGIAPDNSIDKLLDNITYLSPIEKHDILRAAYIGYLTKHFVMFVSVLNQAAQLEINSTSIETKTTSLLEELDDHLHKSLNDILVARGNENIYYATLSFMLTIANICHPGEPIPSFVPTIEWSDENNTTQKVFILGTPDTSPQP